MTFVEVPSGGTPADASLTVKGIVELATTAETTTGTDAVRAVTPAGVKAVMDAHIASELGGMKIVKITQAAYTALGAGRSATTIYFIVG